MVGSIFILSCTQTNKPEAPTDTEEVTIALESPSSSLTNYMELKNYLGKSETEASQLAAKALIKSLTEENEETDIIVTANAIAESNDPEKQLELFQALTNQFIASLKQGGVEKNVYVQFCPMAFDNSGGTWLSLSEEIENPYFGGEMLYCGSVQEILE